MNDTQCLLWATQMLILDPQDWCRGAYARDAAGGPVAPHADHAVCWDATGAIVAASTLHDDRVRAAAHRTLLDAVRRKHGNGTVGKFNDTHSHSAVIRLFDDAIELAA